MIEIVEIEEWNFKVRSSNKRKYYEVVKRRDGESLFCSCPSFKYNEGECKHIKAVKVMTNGS